MATTSFPSHPTLTVLPPSSLAGTRREIAVSNFATLKSLQHRPIRLTTTRSRARGDKVVNNPLFTDDPDNDYDEDDYDVSSTRILEQNELEKTEVLDPEVEISLGEASSKSISIVDKKKKSKMPRLPERDYHGTPSVPIYVMLPLGLIDMSCELVDPDGLTQQLKVLKSINVDGVMVDCWWGIVEQAPQQYNWNGYQKLFQIVRDLGLKLQVVMSFHQCGGNVGDDVHIPLPRWIRELGQENPDIYFTDREGWRNTECLSWGVDKERVLKRRTALEVYFDFMRSFRVEFDDFFESGVISEIEVGLGPCGELRYPSYPEENGWKYPGIGEFQCYDKYLMKSLQKAAEARGHVAWARGPENTGSYNSWPHKTGFFRDGGDYDSYYGKFFLKWYSQVLIDHGDRVLDLANLAFEGYCIAAKVSGIHWWYKTASHAAELTAGFYNPCNRDGYAAIVAMLKKHEASLNFTCVELRTSDQHEGFPEALADPEGLVWQVLNDAWDACIAVASENALPCYDRHGYNKILENAKPHNDPDGKHLSAFTYLRLGPALMEERNLKEFERFVKRMHGESVPVDKDTEESNDCQETKVGEASTKLLSA